GKTILFDVDVTNAPIFAYDVDGARRRITHVAEETVALAMAPDGRELVAGIRRDGRDHVVMVSTADGVERPLTEGLLPSFSVDGREIVYVAPGMPARLHAVGRDGGAPRQIGEVPGQVVDLRTGPDGMVHLALAAGERWEAWRIPLSGGAPEREPAGPWF